MIKHTPSIYYNCPSRRAACCISTRTAINKCLTVNLFTCDSTRRELCEARFNSYWVSCGLTYLFANSSRYACSRLSFWCSLRITAKQFHFSENVMAWVQYPIENATSSRLNHCFSHYCTSPAKETKNKKNKTICLFSDLPMWYFSNAM